MGSLIWPNAVPRPNAVPEPIIVPRPNIVNFVPKQNAVPRPNAVPRLNAVPWPNVLSNVGAGLKLSFLKDLPVKRMLAMDQRIVTIPTKKIDVQV